MCPQTPPHPAAPFPHHYLFHPSLFPCPHPAPAASPQPAPRCRSQQAATTTAASTTLGCGARAAASTCQQTCPNTLPTSPSPSFHNHRSQFCQHQQLHTHPSSPVTPTPSIQHPHLSLPFPSTLPSSLCSLLGESNPEHEAYARCFPQSSLSFIPLLVFPVFKLPIYLHDPSPSCRCQSQQPSPQPSTASVLLIHVCSTRSSWPRFLLPQNAWSRLEPGCVPQPRATWSHLQPSFLHQSILAVIAFSISVRRPFPVFLFIHKNSNPAAVQYSRSNGAAQHFQHPFPLKTNQANKTNNPPSFRVHRIQYKNTIHPFAYIHVTLPLFFRYFFHLVSVIPSPRFNGGVLLGPLPIVTSVPLVSVPNPLVCAYS